MCFLSFVPGPDDTYVFSHNRDENMHRQQDTLTVKQEMVDGRTITMPIDAGAGGTWIGTDGKMVAAILNGFKTKHVRQNKYAFSRGSIIPKLLKIGSVDLFIAQFDFSGLEPFTLIVFDDQKHLWEIGWDARELFTLRLDITKIYTYSSCTLYDSNISSNRYLHFINQISINSTHEEILDFHSLYGEDLNKFVNVSLTEDLKTVAICQIIINDETLFKYSSLIHGKEMSSMTLR